MPVETYSAENVRAARQRLIESGVGAQGPAPRSLGVHAVIERSWRRSITQNPAQNESVSPVFRPVRSTADTLLRAANDVLDRWNDSFADMRVAMFVTDRSGQIIARRVADLGHARRLDSASAAEGFDFSETSLGTNGIGTALEEQTPVFVRGAEHFNDALQGLACAGAPIRDAISGRVIGSIALAAAADAPDPAMLAIAKQAAHQVQDSMLDSAAPGELRALLRYLSSGKSQQPVLALGRGGVFSSTTALPWFSSASQVLLWDELQSYEWAEQTRRLSVSGAPATARRVLSFEGEPIYLVELQPEGPPAAARQLDRQTVPAPTPHEHDTTPQITSTASAPFREPKFRSLRDDPKRILAISQDFASAHAVTLSPEFLQGLVRWDWPGEVAELTSLLTSLAAESHGGNLHFESLPLEIKMRARNLYGIAASEYQAIVEALRDADGNRSRAAESLGIGRTTLYRKMRAFGLDGSGALSA